MFAAVTTLYRTLADPTAWTLNFAPSSTEVRSLSLVMLLLGLPCLIIYGFFYAEIVNSPAPAVLFPHLQTAAQKLVMSTLLLTGPLALLPLRPRHYVMLASPLLALLYIVNLIHILEYNELVSIGAVDAMAATSTGETMEFLLERGPSVLFAVVTGLLLAGAVHAAARRLPLGGRLGISSRAFLLLLVGGTIVLAVHDRHTLFPVSTFKNGVEYVQQIRARQVLMQQRATFTFGAVRDVEVEGPETHVIILGESMRRSHLPQYGYHRNTTPRLSRMDKLVFFDDVVSPATQTNSAVPMMLTPATVETITTSSATSIVSLAREIGFHTYWVSNHDRIFDSHVTFLSEEADEARFVNHSWSAGKQYDENVLPELDAVLANGREKRLIVIHLMGSHGQYAWRVPPKHVEFRSVDCREVAPLCRPQLKKRHLDVINHYDNSVRYTDYVVSEIISRVAALDAVSSVVFVADHGENLYDTEEMLLGHGFPSPTAYEVDVPLMVWFSDRFARRFPETTAAARSNRSTAISSEDLFPTLAATLHASYPQFDRSRSFFDSSFEPAERRVLTTRGTIEPYQCLGSTSEGAC